MGPKMSRPLISKMSSEETWKAFHKQWIEYKQEKNLTTPETIMQLYQCCDKEVRDDLPEKFLHMSEEELMVEIKLVVVVGEDGKALDVISEEGFLIVRLSDCNAGEQKPDGINSMNRPLISNKSDEEIWSALHKQWIKHNQEKNLTTPEETIEQLYQCCEEYVQVELQEKSLDLSEEELVVGKDEKYSEMSVEDQSILNESELLMNLNAEDKRRKNAKIAAIAVGVGVGVGVVTAAVAVVAAPLVLGAAGFTAGGVAAGSAAAAVQSAVYGGATTGIFSALQSAGAVGIAASTSAGIGGAAGGTFGGISAAITAYFEKLKQKKKI